MIDLNGSSQEPASANAVRGTSAHPAHTPGPWQREGRTIYALQHHGWRKGEEQFCNRFSAHVESGYGPDGATPVAELEANARLIAAAPELLEALKNIADPEMMRGEWVGDEIVYRWIGATDFQDIAKAAIAKAEGR